jgi:DNA-binding CsgD family transcriptional regulator
MSEAATGLATAVGRLEEALGVAVDERDRAQTLLAFGRTLASIGRHQDALRAFDEVAVIEGADADIGALARAEAIALGLLDPHRRDALLAWTGPAQPTQAQPVSAGPRALHAAYCLQQAMLGASRGELVALAERALAGDAPLADEDSDGTVLFGLSTALLACDEFAWNERILTAAITHARTHGSMMALATASLARSQSRLAQGRLTEALADVEQAVDAERYGWRHFLPVAFGVLIGIHVDRGEIEAATATAQRFDPLPYAGSAALARLGRGSEANELAREELELARAFGAPRSISVALRTLAHAGALNDLHVPIAQLEEAVQIAAGSHARLEHGRALLDLGTVLRRAGRRSDAGRALGEALEIARGCGARLVEERALEELDVAGARVQRAALRGVDALSPSERRVVGLAVEGLSNRQIAEALFVTRKAVEWHLGNAYRKLDVRSRHQLPAALGVPHEHTP